MPAALPNGGLYRGPQINKYFVPQEVVPTTTYFNQVLLKNSDPGPPPGATQHYPGTQDQEIITYLCWCEINGNSAYPKIWSI